MPRNINRRDFLAGCGTVAAFGLAGCTDRGQPTTGTEVTVLDYSFTRIDEASQEHTVQEFSGGVITIVGITIVGVVSVRNGCQTLAIIEEPSVTEDGNRISVTIGSKLREDSTERLCTQAIRQLAYRLQIEVDGEPKSVQLSEKGVNSETTELSLSNGSD